MSLDVINISTTVPGGGSNYNLANDLMTKVAEALAPFGWVTFSDSVGSQTVPRVLVLGHPDCAYHIGMASASYAGTYQYFYIRSVSIDGIANIGDWGFYLTTASNPMQGGTIKVLMSATLMLITFTMVNGDTRVFANIKFSDGVWYSWGTLFSNVTNGAIMNNIDNTARAIATPSYYPNFSNGSYPLLPWLVQESNFPTIRNAYPSNIYTCASAAFANYDFFVIDGVNYFKHGNLLFSDQ